jgi:hypothetical protein
VRLDPLCPSTVFVALADPPPGREAEFHHWYDTVHGPDALANGSFTAVHRFRAVGEGHRAAPFLALWEGRFADEAEAWGYIAPLAHELREAGRVGDIASVRFAIMLFGVTVPATVGLGPSTAACEPVGTLTTVQNAWRHPEAAPAPGAWFAQVTRAGSSAIESGSPSWLATSDPAGRGRGHHLAIFPSRLRADSVAESWRTVASAGMSPLPPYQTIFGGTAGADAGVEVGTAGGAADELPVADAWVMHWEPVASLRA